MGKVTGFLEFERRDLDKRPATERVKDFHEFYVARTEYELKAQGARCMDCGIPFCQGPTGCPLGNLIPDWNDLAYRGEWDQAVASLHRTNNFPEVTGRICPAPCEQACTLNINGAPVTIKQLERAIGDRALSRPGEGGLAPRIAKQKTGKRVGVIGSGPAGLAAAQQLARAGHDVTVFEKHDRVGGLLRYGIPDFKLEKHLIELRLAQMEAEGVEFRTGAHVGVNVDPEQLMVDHDAILLACGAEKPRDLPIDGRDLKGIHFAMDFLTQQNRRVAGDSLAEPISAEGRRVVVLGGGDTGSDCIGTSHRQGARWVMNLELMPKPPESRAVQPPWPWWPYILQTSHAHEEGGERDWAVLTKRFIGDGDGNVAAIEAIRLEWSTDGAGRRAMKEIPGSEFRIECDLVLLALGFVHPVHEGLIETLGVKLTSRGNVATNRGWRTSREKIFCAGDMTRGQSLVVHAISDGRRAAREIDRFLMGQTELPVGPRRDLPDQLAEPAI